jgi:hypothetical protein
MAMAQSREWNQEYEPEASATDNNNEPEASATDKNNEPEASVTVESDGRKRKPESGLCVFYSLSSSWIAWMMSSTWGTMAFSSVGA